MRGVMAALIAECEREGKNRRLQGLGGTMAGKGTITCAVRGHAPGPEQIENDGIAFGRCRRCGTDLIRRSGRWQPVPKGFRVAWRPRADSDQAAAEPETQAATVLVCDDDPLILDLLDYRLSARGYRVELARDGQEGLARVAERRPDAMVLDAMMPRVDGFEVLRKLRESEETRRIPVIILTARRQERDVLDALKLGADDFLTKPFIPEELLSRLALLLARARA
jgi:CheY-like chemotaxis protein